MEKRVNDNGGQSKEPWSSIIVNNSFLPCISPLSSIAKTPLLFLDQSEEFPQRNPKIVREDRRYLKAKGIRPYCQFLYSYASLSFSLSISLPLCLPSSPFLASSKIEIFHPSELICTDWLTSSEFPDRHVNPRGFGAHLYEGASARITHANRLSCYKAKSCCKKVLQWELRYSIASKRISTSHLRLVMDLSFILL